MAGGKETPRQKMIGMMYLVLTAMLALNVSNTILDAFVAIEENMQVSNENEFARGNEKKEELKEVAQDKTNPEAAKKAQLMLDAIDKVDAEVAKRIKFIDDLKVELLTMIGEDLAKKGEEAIIRTAYDSKVPTKPVRMDLANVQAKDKYDEPMLLMGINENLKAPKGKGLELWNQMNSFRAEIVKIFVESSPKPDNAPAYFFKDPKIVKYKDVKDLKKQILAAIEKSNVPKDEREEIADLYMGLTKNEIVQNHDRENIHWIGKTFDHAPAVAALASLTSLENEILTARANVISRIRSRVGGGEYSFNKVTWLANGPDLVNANDSVLVNVLMAAYDSDRQPEVTLGDQKISEVRDGQGFVRVKAGATDMTLKGTITIKKKDGSPKTLDWEKEIKVMKPSANLMLPELMVLYKGYDNKVKGVASGYDQTVLSASGGISLVKSGDVYIAKVPNSAGKTGTISVSGKSSVTGKTANLGTFTFDLKPMPTPTLFVDGQEPGGKINKRATAVNVSYGPGIPLKAVFSVQNWTVGVQGIMREATGSGNSLGAAIPVLNQGKPGSKVYVSATVRMPNGLTKKVFGEFTL
ncbi:MAG: hypothetical protein J0G96_00570 [Flavobacteriia bacterium]|nr:hypothetical protein [Flavobacteriia bacterium]OJX36177.1 MAG: hypothetical protein BGO87_06850 [Flavobacteriia bacterium 40-80]